MGPEGMLVNVTSQGRVAPVPAAPQNLAFGEGKGGGRHTGLGGRNWATPASRAAWEIMVPLWYFVPRVRRGMSRPKARLKQSGMSSCRGGSEPNFHLIDYRLGLLS